MERKDVLLELIKRLLPAEKRYFRKQKSENSDFAYMRFFEFIHDRLDKNKKIDYELFDNTYRGNVLAVRKRHLRKKILESLRSYHAEKSTRMTLSNQIQDVEVLYRKGLLEQCYKTINQGNKLADKRERFNLSLEYLSWAQRLAINREFTSSLTVEHVSGLEGEILEKQQGYFEIRNFYNAVTSHKRRYGISNTEGIKKLSESVDEKFLDSSYEYKSKKEGYYYHWAMSVYHWVRSEHALAYPHSKRLLDDLTGILDAEELYDGHLEHLTSCLFNYKYPELLDTLDFLEELLLNYKQFNDFKSVELHFLYYKSSYELAVLCFMGEEVRLSKKLAAVKVLLLERQSEFAPVVQTLINTNVIQANMVLGSYGDAKTECFKLLNHPPEYFREDIVEITYVILFIILLMTGETELLASRVESALRWFRANKESYWFEIKTANLIKSNLGLSKNEQTKLCAAYIAEIIPTKIHLQDNPRYNESSVVLMWAKSVLSQRSLSEEYKVWYAGKVD